MLVDADVASAPVITTFSILVAGSGAVLWILRSKLPAWRKNLFHEQADRNRLQRIVDGLRDQPLSGIRLSYQIGEVSAGLPLGIASDAPDDLHNLRQAGAVANRQGVLPVCTVSSAETQEPPAIERGFLLYSASRFVQKKGRRGSIEGKNPEYTENTPNVYLSCFPIFTLYFVDFKKCRI